MILLEYNSKNINKYKLLQKYKFKSKLIYKKDFNADKLANSIKYALDRNFICNVIWIFVKVIKMKLEQ